MRIKAVLLALVVCAPTISLGQAAEDDRKREEVLRQPGEMDFINPYLQRKRKPALTPLPLDGLQAVCAVRARWFGELEELLGKVQISETTILVARYYLDMVDLCWPTTSDVETCTALSERFHDRESSLTSILRAATYAKAGLDLNCWGG